jgi:HEAT repeat protein
VAAQTIPLLNDALGDRDETVQRAALDGIQGAARVVGELYANNAGPLGDAARPKEGASRFEPLRPVLRGLVASVPQLAKPLAARDPATRLAAAHTLESLAVTRRTILNTRPSGEPVPADSFTDAWSSVRPVLTERVKDADPQVRLAAVQAMESLGDGLDTRDLLRQATSDRVVFIRWAAARALGRSAPDKPDAAAVAGDVAALARLVADPDPDVRTAALTALARFGPAAQSATDAVLGAASRGDIEPRVAAVKALGALQTDAGRTVPILIAALRPPELRVQPDLRLQRAAAAGLTRFGPDARAALPELRQAVLSDDQELRLAAAEAILAIERVPRVKEL